MTVTIWTERLTKRYGHATFVMEDIDAHAGLAQQVAAFPVDQPNVEALLTDRLVSSGSLPSAAEVAAEMTQLDAERVVHRAARHALDILEDHLLSTVVGSAADLIAGTIRPPLEAIITAATAAVEALGNNEADDPLRLLVAPVGVREARAALDDIVSR